MRKIAFTALLAAGLLQTCTALAYADWAIAVGQEGSSNYSYGTAYNYTSTEEAHQKALSNCRSEGRNCKVIADGAGSCAAVAFSTSNSGYGWSTGDSKREASRAALKKCYEYAASDCEVRDSFCDE